MVLLKTDLSMAMAITCMLKTASLTACYQTNPATNGSYGSYYNTLSVVGMIDTQHQG
jgi:hypothetical protein